MATKTIAWATGSGNITLTYTGQGNGSIIVASDENNSFDERSQNINIVTTDGTPQQAVSVLVKQKGKTYPVGEVFNFAYTGSVQQITLPKGKYKLQCWGAQGGNVTGTYAVNGSKGGYSEGVLTLTKTTTLYIFVGGQGTSYTSSATQTSTTVINGGWNGGGAGARTLRYTETNLDVKSFPRGGGGGTDIALATSSMSYSSGVTSRSSASLLSRIIVAGGGGGACARYVEQTTITSQDVSNVIVNEQMPFVYVSTQSSGNKVYWITKTITAKAGLTYKYSATANTTLTVYTEGFFDSNGNNIGWTYQPTADTTIYARTIARGDSSSTANGTVSLKVTEVSKQDVPTTTTSSSKSNQSQQGGGVQGKGTYPGKESSAPSGGKFGIGGSQTTLQSYRYYSGAGGGGWYGGGRGYGNSASPSDCGGGSGFVNTSANASYRPSGYTGLQLDSGTTTAGNSSFPSTSGGTETGHSGNGYARITVIE